MNEWTDLVPGIRFILCGVGVYIWLCIAGLLLSIILGTMREGNDKTL